MENKVYLLTNREFVLLAAVAGIRKLYGFEMKADEMAQEEAIYELHNLAKKNYLKVVDGSFTFTEEMNGLFSQIRDADTTMDVHKASGRSCILYVGNRVVKVSPSMRRADVYEVMLLEQDEVWKHLKEEGWIMEEDDVRG